MNFFDYSSTLLIMFNVFAFVFFILLVIILFKFYKINVKKEEDIVKEKTFKKALSDLEKSQKIAADIITGSSLKAQEILKDAEFITEESKASLLKKIEDMSSKQLSELGSVSKNMMDSYLKALGEQSERGVGAIRQISESLESEAEKEIDEFKQVLHEETIESERAFEEKLNKEYESMRQEMIRKIDVDRYKILLEVSKAVIGKSIDLETHQDLIIDALESAKKDNVFRTN